MTGEKQKKIVEEFNTWLISEYGKIHTVDYTNPDPIAWWIAKIDEAIKEEHDRIMNEINKVSPINLHEFMLRSYLVEEISRIIG